MKDFKKKLKLSGIIILCCLALNALSIFADFYYYKFSLLGVILDVFGALATIFTGVFYLVMSKKSDGFLLQHISWFNFVSFFNIINIFIIWLLAFYIQIMLIRGVKLNAFNMQKNQATNNTNENEIVLNENEYFVHEEMNNLTAELNDLENKKNNNTISGEEYERLKNECIKKYINPKN